ncbi:MAG: exo-alpha-sialidase [Victivallaceae bacterium]|nr:exo-alpha-sialidase [Victivallaceae bacterium]
MQIIQENIFEPNIHFKECHASTLVELSNNNFMVCWFGGAKEGRDDVAIWISKRINNQWTTPLKVVKIFQEPYWNPVLFKDQTGKIHLFFKIGRELPTWKTWVITSDDQGVTWSIPKELVLGDTGGRGPVKNKPIVLSDGSWLAPASIERGWWEAFVDCSQDQGKSWQASDLIRMDKSMFVEGDVNLVPEGHGVIQPTLWESTPGTVHMLLRSSCGNICRSDSNDYGQNWCSIYKTDLPNNNSGIDVVKLKNGILVLACNPTSIRGVRTPLTLSCSHDNGKSWSNFITLENEPQTIDKRVEFSYPAIIETNCGVAVTYTWQRKTIKFCKICNIG